VRRVKRSWEAQEKAIFSENIGEILTLGSTKKEIRAVPANREERGRYTEKAVLLEEAKRLVSVGRGTKK